MNNKQRLKVLEAKNNHLDKLMELIREKLGTVSAQPQYKALLHKLILQSFTCLLETDVEIQCVDEEESLIKEIVPQVVQEFESLSQLKVVPKINPCLTRSSVGGVIVTALDGRIKSLNTLEHRLVCMTDQVLYK